MHANRIIPPLILLFGFAGCTSEFLSPTVEQESAQSLAVFSFDQVHFPIEARIDTQTFPDLTAHWNETFGRLEVADQKGLDLFLMRNGVTCDEFAEEVEASIFQITYARRDDSLLVYQTSLPDGTATYWHLFASMNINGHHYTFQSNPLVAFTEAEINRMTQLVLSIEPAQTGVYSNHEENY